VLKNADGSVWCTEAINWESDDPHSVRKIGVKKSTFQNDFDHGLTWAIGQFYGVLSTGLISADHIFCGLRRRMSVNGNSHADSNMLIFTWVAHRDAEMSREGELTFCAAEVGSIFFVIVSKNTDQDTYPDIYGWAERWGWLPGHSTIKGAPVDFDSRYDTRVWSQV
jgi:hypothetical protein